MKENLVLLLAQTEKGADCYYYVIANPAFKTLLRPSLSVTHISKYAKIVKSGYGLPSKKNQEYSIIMFPN
jgi:hypothetical protein